MIYISVFSASFSRRKRCMDTRWKYPVAHEFAIIDKLT